MVGVKEDTMWSRPPLEKIGALDCLLVGQKPERAVVLFHGFGADAYDLSSLSEELFCRTPPPKRALVWAFPQGPLTADLGGGYLGRAWFPVDFDQHERAHASGARAIYEDAKPKGMVPARDQALSFLRSLERRVGEGASIKNLILGGFSQGSMMALEVALNLQENPLGLLLYSTTLVNRANLREVLARRRSEGRAPIPVYMCHGEFDTVLPFSGAEELRDELLSHDWPVIFESFPGGHEIPGGAGASFLRSLID